jgi:hypothetical protein
MVTYIYDIKAFDWNEKIRTFSISNSSLSPKILRDDYPNFIEIVNSKTGGIRSFKFVDHYEEYITQLLDEEGEEGYTFRLEYLIYKSEQDDLECHVYLSDLTKAFEL